MATAAIAGRISTMKVDTNTGSPTFADKVGELLDVTDDLDREQHDATNKDSGGFMEHVSGHGSGNLNGAFNHVGGDNGQDILWDAIESGNKIAVEARSESVVGKDEWLVTVTVESIEPAAGRKVAVQIRVLAHQPRCSPHPHRR